MLHDPAEHDGEECGCEDCVLDQQSSDYSKYRGKCQQMSEAAAAADPTLRVVRGHYLCPIWGEQEHWWCVKPDGTVVDPTSAQFPSRGLGEYREWDGKVSCAECHKVMTLDQVGSAEGRYAFCSSGCHGRFVGVFL